MIENRPYLTYLSHAILIIGVLIIAFPIYVALVTSSHEDVDVMSTVQPWFGDSFIDNYVTVLVSGKVSAGGIPLGSMMLNSLIMAVGIVVGKISISIISAFAIVYFRFPGRMFCFWIIFMTLMLPVEVRILPTYKVVVDLGLLNTYTGLTLPDRKSTRLNSSHKPISYAVFCLKKKNPTPPPPLPSPSPILQPIAPATSKDPRQSFVTHPAHFHCPNFHIKPVC